MHLSIKESVRYSEEHFLLLELCSCVSWISGLPQILLGCLVVAQSDFPHAAVTTSVTNCGKLTLLLF